MTTLPFFAVQAHTETFGNPTPAKARISEVEGKCILVSGHDLKDLEALLQQTEGKVLYNTHAYAERKWIEK